ncbi:Hypothetical predicted protein [Paramuricea clavata]|uniref:Glycosyltransferase family 92 protein n=1 Tax=Paramuricea clavata TaxID=317549 RepID=A0A6S7GSM7_PARCT|nr:Hypothetical predicted protein [Paramuricea clavata]
MGYIRLRFNKSWTMKAFLLIGVIFILLNSFLFIIVPNLYPHGYAHYLYGVPVELPECEPNSEKYYLTLTAIVRNRAKYMPEWIEFHLMHGVEHVYLYDNNSTDNLEETLRPYIEANLLTIQQFPNKVMILFDGTEEILTQKLFLKNTIESHACDTRWMAMLDSDEFILPGAGRGNKSLRDILKLYEAYSALVMPWVYFTSNGWVRTPQDKLIIEAYTRRWKIPKHTWKQIIQPKRTNRVYSSHNFGSVSDYYAVNENSVPFANWPAMFNGFMTKNFYKSENFYSYDVIRLHHYKLRSAEDWERRKVIGKITGTDTGLGKRAMKEHWDEYFELDAVESLTDNTMLEYVEPLKDKMRKRFL